MTLSPTERKEFVRLMAENAMKQIDLDSLFVLPVSFVQQLTGLSRQSVVRKMPVTNGGVLLSDYKAFLSAGGCMASRGSRECATPASTD